MSEIQARKSLSKVVFLIILNLCVYSFHILVFMFVDQLLLVDVFSHLYYLTYVKKEQWWTSVINHEKLVTPI